MPLIEFLQSDIPVLSSLPGSPEHLTVLSLIKSIGSAKGLNLGMLDDIVQLANLIKAFSDTSSFGLINLGKLDFLETSEGLEQSVSNVLSGVGKFDSSLFEFSNGTGNNDDFGGLNGLNLDDSDYGLLFPLFKMIIKEFDIDALKSSAISFCSDKMLT